MFGKNLLTKILCADNVEQTFVIPLLRRSTMAKQFEITEEMKSMIGWESEPYPYEVTTTSVRAFARGVGYTDPVYYNIEAAKKAGYNNLPAPPTYLGTPVFVPGELDDNLSIPTSSMPPIKVDLIGLLDGGTVTDYYETICAGDTLTAVSKLANLETKESKSLGIMLIMTLEISRINQDGKLVAKQTATTILY